MEIGCDICLRILKESLGKPNAEIFSFIKVVECPLITVNGHQFDALYVTPGSSYSR